MSASYVSMAKDYKADPALIEPVPDIGLMPEEVNLQENVARAKEMRPELYALLAVVIDEVLDVALEGKQEFPPYGLIDWGEERVASLRDFYELDEFLRPTLGAATAKVLTKHEEEATPLHQRLGYVCSVFNSTYEGARYESPEKLIRSGIGTAAKETTTALRAVSRIVRNHRTNNELPAAESQDIAKIARQSSILINRAAAVNVQHLPAAGLLMQLAGETLDPQFVIDVQALQLRTRGDGTEYVDFKQPIVQIQSPSTSSARTVGSAAVTFETQGCPAMAKLNGTSAINRLWNWAIDIAEREDLFLGTDVYELSD